MLSELDSALSRAEVTSPVLDKLQDLLEELRSLDAGEVATYIPELGRADPDWFGISVVTSDGHVFEVGESRQEFTIQSISKPFVFGMALEERGREAVMGHVGVEPSGNAFNAIVVDETNRPFNPMVNAGAIVTTGLIARSDPAHALDRVLDVFGRFAGRDLSIDDAVYESESATGDRNRALAFLMKSFGVLDGDVETAVDLYFQQCSLLVTARDLAVMGATLANRGVNPITGRARDRGGVRRERPQRDEHVRDVRLRRRMGLPRRAAREERRRRRRRRGAPRAVRHRRVLAAARRQGQQRARRRGVPPPRDRFRAAPAALPAARRGRGASHRRAGTRPGRTGCARSRPTSTSREHASCIVVYELEGDLYFGSMERVFRRIAADLDTVRFVVLDCKRVTSVDPAARSMLLALEAELVVGRSITGALVHAPGVARVRAARGPARPGRSRVSRHRRGARGLRGDPAGRGRLRRGRARAGARVAGAARRPLGRRAPGSRAGGGAAAREHRRRDRADGRPGRRHVLRARGIRQRAGAARLGTEPPSVDAGRRRGVRRDGDPRRSASLGRRRRRRRRCAGAALRRRPAGPCHRAPEPRRPRSTATSRWRCRGGFAVRTNRFGRSSSSRGRIRRRPWRRGP